MNNNVDAILGITTTENSQVPFIVNLINTLKDNQLISEGITIPFLIGAYKIQENDTTIPTLDYLKSTLQKIINSLGEYKLFIKTCSNINQYVISIIGDKDIDIIGNDAPYPYIADSSGCKVLFFEEYLIYKLHPSRMLAYSSGGNTLMNYSMRNTRMRKEHGGHFQMKN